MQPGIKYAIEIAFPAIILYKKNLCILVCK